MVICCGLAASLPAASPPKLGLLSKYFDRSLFLKAPICTLKTMPFEKSMRFTGGANLSWANSVFTDVSSLRMREIWSSSSAILASLSLMVDCICLRSPFCLVTVLSATCLASVYSLRLAGFLANCLAFFFHSFFSAFVSWPKTCEPEKIKARQTKSSLVFILIGLIIS